MSFAKLTRRGFLAVSASLGAAACGGGGAPPESAPKQREVTTDLGTYTVPEQPGRVFAVDPRVDLDVAATLGLPVVGYTGDAPYWVPVPFGARHTPAPVDVAKVRELAPDLVVCTNVKDPRWLADGLGGVAPVLPVDPNAPWRDTLLAFQGWLPSTRRAAERATGTYDSRVARLRERFPEQVAGARLALVGSFTGVSFSDRGLPPWVPGQAAADLGARVVRFADSPTAELGADQAGVLAGADAVLLLTEDPFLDAESLPADPLFGQVPAVAAGRFVLGPDLTYGSAHAALEVVELLTQLYEKL